MKVQNAVWETRVGENGCVNMAFKNHEMQFTRHVES